MGLAQWVWRSIADVSSSVDAPVWTQCSGSGAFAVLLVFVSVNQVLVRLWARVPGTGSGAMACVTMTRSSACSTRADGPLFDGMSDREMRSCEGMAAPVIGSEGSEALCERLTGSAGSRIA